MGHSLGGAVATLATLWVLGKRSRKISPFCITFGCPLVGDERLVEAVGRENWGGNFCELYLDKPIYLCLEISFLHNIQEQLKSSLMDEGWFIIVTLEAIREGLVVCLYIPRSIEEPFCFKK